ncbi:MAG: hypothetical protein ACYDGR_01405 [Candidatus Dormibacteria bacterium]
MQRDRYVGVTVRRRQGELPPGAAPTYPLGAPQFAGALVEVKMDRDSFYLIFVVIFTITAFLIGSILAMTVMGANLSSPDAEEPEGGSHHAA